MLGNYRRDRSFWLPDQGLVVEQVVEQLHDQQATQAALS
jgi:hypothetical protein